MDEVRNHKPHPEGLLRILETNSRIFYIGDTVDDARAARAAQVPFIGIAAPSNSTYLDLVFLFQAEKAYAIVDDINKVLPRFAARALRVVFAKAPLHRTIQGVAIAT
jgi:HAD superfamily phosphatase